MIQKRAPCWSPLFTSTCVGVDFFEREVEVGNQTINLQVRKSHDEQTKADPR